MKKLFLSLLFTLFFLPNLFAVTVNLSTVGSGKDYETLQEWEDDVDGNLVSLDTAEVVEVYGVLTGSVTINGSTTDVDHYIKITVPESLRHNGIWDITKSSIVSSDDGIVIIIYDAYVIVEWLQIYPKGDSGSSTGITTYNPNTTIRYNLIDGHDSSNVQGIQGGNNSNSQIYRNIIYGCADEFEGGIRLNGGGGTLVYYNTFFKCSHGIRTNNATDVMIGNAIFDSIDYGDFYDNTGSASSGYNCISDNSAMPGSNNLSVKNAYDNFVSTVAASENLHIKNNAADLYNAGTDLGSPYDVDIDSETVTGIWDIGADEYTAIGPPTPTSFSGTVKSISSIEWGWDDISGEDGYRVYSSTSDTVVQVLSIGVTYWIESSLTANTSFQYYIKSWDEQGESSASSAILKYTFANVPTSLSIVDVFYSSATLSWSGDGTGYQIIMDTTTDFSTTITTYTLSEQTTTFASLLELTTYWWKVRGYNGDTVYTIFTSSVSTTTVANPFPDAPTNFAGVVQSTGSIAWSWDNVTGEDGFKVYSSTGGIMQTLAADTLTWNQSGLDDNTLFQYYVVAYVTEGNSDSSNVISLYTFANAPTGLTVSDVGYSSMTVTWTGNGGTNYDAIIADDASFSTNVSTNNVASQNYTFTGLFGSSVYFIRVRGYNGDAITTAYTNIISSETFVTPTVEVFDYNVTETHYIVNESSGYPDLFESRKDSTFNTTFSRVTEASDAGSDMAVPIYSRWSPLNCDGTRLIFQKTVGNPDSLLYNAITYELIMVFPAKTTIDGVPNQSINTQESSELRWSKVDPDLIYLVNGMSFMEWNIVTDTATTVHDFSVEFPSQGIIHNDVEGDCDESGRYWCWMVKGPYLNGTNAMHAIITYDKQTDTILGTLDYADYLALGGGRSKLPTPNMVDMSPDGSRCLLLLAFAWDDSAYDDGDLGLDIGTLFDGVYVWDLDFTNPQKVAPDQTHGGWGWDYDGNLMYVFQNNKTDWLEATDIQTGGDAWDTRWDVMRGDIRMFEHPDMGYGNGFHFARMPESTPGWNLVSTYKSPASSYPAAWGDNQLLMIELVDKDVTNPTVWRLGHMYNVFDEYYAEGFATMSQFGDKFWWVAKWFGQSDIETYEMLLPDGWWTAIGSTSDTVTVPIPVPNYPSPNYTQDADCLFAYPMDQDVNPTIDQSKNSLDGALKAAGEPNYTNVTVPGIYSTGNFLFDGVDDYITLSTATNVTDSSFSVCFWFRQDVSPSNDYYTFIYMDDEFRICRNGTDDGIAIVVDDGSGNYQFETSVFEFNSIWNHVVFTWNTATNSAAIYLNSTTGTLVSSSGFSYSGMTDNVIRIGCMDIGQTGFVNGYFDEVAVFKRVLTSAEATNIFNNGLLGYESGSSTEVESNVLMLQ